MYCDHSHSYFHVSHTMNSSLCFKNFMQFKKACIWFDILSCWRKTGQVEIINQFMLVFREGPEGDFNDLLFLSSIVNYNIYLHPPQGDPTNCYYLYIHSVTCTNTLFTQDIANSFSAMLHFCNYEHKLDPTGIITFGIGNSFKFSMLNSKLAIMLDS